VGVFDLRDFVFDPELLAFPVGDEIGIGHGAVGFGAYGVLQAAMLGPEGLDAIV
jgi:hypothetical protein